MKTPYVKFFRNVKNQPRRFNHVPRFYDAKKEERERRRSRVEMEVALEKGQEVDEYVPRPLAFSRHKSATTGVKKYSSSQKKMANMRLIIILTLLFAAAYYGIRYLEHIGQ